MTVGAEAFDVLLELALRSHDAPMANLFATRALQASVGADFAVARDALEALLRRADSADDVSVVRSSDGYRTRRAGRDGRPYEIWIGDVERGEGSCSCADFGKASLGLCKHVIAVLQSPRVRQGEARALRWNPVRPLTGPGGRLDRLWHDPEQRLPRGLADLFQAAPAARPIDTSRLTSERGAIVERLLAACRREPALAEPAVVRLLEQEHAAAGRAPRHVERRELMQLLGGFKRKLYPYQRDGVAAFLRVGRLLLADDMGLGKTAQAIACCHALFRGGKIKRALVVAPASLKPQWVREWATFTDLEITMIDGDPQTRAAQYQHGRRGGVLLVNYEQLLRDLPEVLRYAPELVILDEAQRIKNWETRTAAVVKQLQPAWRLVLTGTPMENRLEELSSIMEWVDEHALEPRWRLSSWHVTRVDGTREITGARNLDTLRTRLAPAMLRRVRHEVLAQLPPRRDTIVPTALGPEQQAAHDDLNLPIARIACQARRRPLTRGEFLKLMTLLARQRMLCNALVLPEFATIWPDLAATKRRSQGQLDALGSPKLLDLRERLSDLVVGQRRKVVVFSQWRRMLQLAAWVCGDIFEQAGVRGVFFTGQETQRRRTENLVAFHDDPATRVLFASDAGGIGLNLQHATSCCINLELPWNPAVLEQRIGRVARLGQKEPVDVWNYVATGGIEERIARLVGDKQALFSGLFDGTSDEVAFDSSGSFLARVREIVPEENEHDEEQLDRDAHVLESDELAEAVADAGQPEEVVTKSAGAADLGGDERGGTNARGETTPATSGMDQLLRAFAGLEARAVEGGRVVFELPAPAASALGGLLRSLASAIESSAHAAHGVTPASAVTPA
ncbi:DEAD/DEAH box helicase [soil metagenome]